MGILLGNGQSEPSDWESSGRPAKRRFLCWSVGDIRKLYGNWILVQDFWQPSTPGKQQALNQMCASSCGKAACCFHPSAHFPFRSIRFHVSAPAALVILPALFGYWRRLFFFDSHLGAVPYLPKFWVYSDASNVILFSSYNGGQGPVVLGIVKMPCKRMYIIQMCFRQGKQKKE